MIRGGYGYFVTYVVFFKILNFTVNTKKREKKTKEMRRPPYCLGKYITGHVFLFEKDFYMDDIENSFDFSIVIIRTLLLGFTIF
jgi:hypothetical protein